MTLTAPPRLLLVHAHPDDESIWTGGTIARYAAQGVHVTVVTCTLGEEGEIIPASLHGLAADQADQLGGYRVGELRAACIALGVTDHRFLGGVGRWRDSGMAGVPSNSHPRAFAGAGLDEQAEALTDVLRQVRPQVVVTYDANGGYGHPDHIRAHDLTMAVVGGIPDVQRVFHAAAAESAITKGVRELADLADLPYRLPQPGELPTVPDTQITTVIDVSEHQTAKIRALRAHPTQVQVWQNDSGDAAYALSNGIAQPFTAAEYYVLAAGQPDGAATDLFSGLGGGQVAEEIR